MFVVLGENIHTEFFFPVLNVRAALPSTPDTRMNVRLGDRYCILFALCILGAVAAAGVCKSVSMPWAWAFVCRSEVGIEYLPF